MEDFRKYATKHLGMSGTALDSYMNISSSYISPTIIEERQLNVAQMDVFSRLMMGAQSVEANVNAGLAAARQIVAFLEHGDAKFKVNK